RPAIARAKEEQFMIRFQSIAGRWWSSMYPQRRRGASVVNRHSSATTRLHRRARSLHFPRGSTAAINVCAVVVAVIALPFMFGSTTGCEFQGVGPDPVAPNAYTCACSCDPGVRHRSLRVAAGADDAEQQLDGTILLNSVDLDFQT